MTSPRNPRKFEDMLFKKSYPKAGKERKLSSKRETRVGWLRKKGKSDKQLLALSDKLEGCSQRNRCKSAACPECAYAGQRLLAQVSRRFVRAQRNGGTIVFVSVIPADGTISPASLSQQDHQRAIRRWRDKLARVGVPWFVGATDISFNEHEKGRYQPHWSEHIYGVTVTDNPTALRKRLKKLFPKAVSIAKPVTVTVWDGKKQPFLYLLKPNFWRRIGTDEGQRFDKKTRSKRACRDTDIQPLRSGEKRKLLAYLDQVGMSGRLLMRNTQLVSLTGTGPTILLRGRRVVGTKGRKLAS
jgi:hypothetical protein